MNWKLEEVVDEDMVDGMMGSMYTREEGKDNRVYTACVQTYGEI
jgi:glycyl-tRNA synthetase beta subunit